MKKKLLALLLVAVMVISLVPISALAASECDHSLSNYQTIKFDSYQVDATCTEPGVRAVYHCTLCRQYFCSMPGGVLEAISSKNDPVVIPAKGHQMNGVKCTVCGEADPNHVHDWSYTEIPIYGKHTKKCACGEEVEETCNGCDVTGCDLCGSDLLGIHPDDGTGHCVGCKACLDNVLTVKYDANGHWWEHSCGEVHTGPVPHEFENGTCSVCGAANVAACGHPKYDDYNEFQTKKDGFFVYRQEKAATCTENGHYGNAFCWGCNTYYLMLNGELTPAANTSMVEIPAAHSAETYTDTKQANCTDKGYVKTYCKACDALIDEEELPTNDEHFFYNGKCMKCGKSEACEHTGETYTDTKQANCTDKGYVKTYCKDCDALIDEEELPTNDEHFFYNGKCLKCGTKDECEHEYEVVKELAPTCVEAGYVWMECKHCGAEKNYEAGEPTGIHDYKTVKELAPNCVEAGYVWQECANCGAEKNFESGEPTGIHDYKVVKEQAPTCIEAGYVWKECSVCGAEKNHEVGAPTGKHVYETVKEEKATCTEPGYVWQECTTPGCDWEKNFEVPALGTEHGDTYTFTVEADCTDEGVVEVYCKDCEALLSKETLPTNDRHYFYNGKCLKCGAEEAPCEHAETYEDIVEANCSKVGVKKVICKACGELVSKEELPVNDNHAFYNGKCLLCGIDEEPVEKPTEPEVKPTEPEEKPTEPEEKPTEPEEEPTEKPTEKPADPELDDVPKTGTNTGMILATMTGIALICAMAFVFGKKRSAC